VVQLHQQRRRVLAGGHRLAELPESRVEIREADLRLRELNLLLLGLREGLLGRCEILVERGDLRALGRKGEEPIRADQPESHHRQQDVSVALGDRHQFPPAGEAPAAEDAP
jgi:hypothetical protein